MSSSEDRPQFRVDGIDYAMLAQSRAQIIKQQQQEQQDRLHLTQLKIAKAAAELHTQSDEILQTFKVNFSVKEFQGILRNFVEEKNRLKRNDSGSKFLKGRVMLRFNSSSREFARGFIGSYTKSIEDCPMNCSRRFAEFPEILDGLIDDIADTLNMKKEERAMKSRKVELEHVLEKLSRQKANQNEKESANMQTVQNAKDSDEDAIEQQESEDDDIFAGIGTRFSDDEVEEKEKEIQPVKPPERKSLRTEYFPGISTAQDRKQIYTTPQSLLSYSKSITSSQSGSLFSSSSTTTTDRLEHLESLADNITEYDSADEILTTRKRSAHTKSAWNRRTKRK